MPLLPTTYTCLHCSAPWSLRGLRPESALLRCRWCGWVHVLCVSTPVHPCEHKVPTLVLG